MKQQQQQSFQKFGVFVEKMIVITMTTRQCSEEEKCRELLIG
jgi:hypothetical protein